MSINSELQTTLQKIADNYGVIITNLNVSWIEADTLNKQKRIVNKLEIGVKLIEPA